MDIGKHTQGDNATRDVALLCDVEVRRIAPCYSVNRRALLALPYPRINIHIHLHRLAALNCDRLGQSLGAIHPAARERDHVIARRQRDAVRPVRRDLDVDD